jgi:hypothetical protein
MFTLKPNLEPMRPTLMILVKKAFIYFLILHLAIPSVKAQNFEWVVQYGGFMEDGGMSITTDDSGDVYAVGNFNGTVDFDPGPGTYNLTTNGTWDVFITRLDASGNMVWARNVGGGDSDNAESVAVDASGNVYLTGTFLDTADFDPGPGVFNLISSGGYRIFVLKLNAAGNLVWAKQFEGGIINTAKAIDIDVAGNVLTTGRFSATVDFDPGVGIFNLSGASSTDIYISKLDSAGNFLWAKRLGDIGTDCGYALTTDASGNIYTTGFFQNTVDFDPGPSVNSLTSYGVDDIFVSKLDPSGNFLWANQLGGTGYDNATTVATDAAGNILLAGWFQDTADFDPGPGNYSFIATATTDGYICKLDANGNFAWARHIHGNGNVTNRSIDIDVVGSIYLTGHFNDTVDFDPGIGIYELIDTGGGDGFICKYDTTGNFVWATQLESDIVFFSISVSVDLTGNVYSTGAFKGTTDFDPGSGIYNVTAIGDRDAHILKLNQDPTAMEDISMKDDFAIYPNPATDILNITLPNNESRPVEFKIYNLLGENIISEIIPCTVTSKMEFNADVSGLLNGIYFVEVKAGDRRWIEKILIE